MKQKYSKDYTLSQSGYQLVLPLNLETFIASDDKVRLLSQFVEELDLTDLVRTYDRIRKNTATPRQMLKIVLYAAMNRLYSSRDIETACKRDINFMFLLEGSPAPDHATIARFKYLHFSEVSEKYLAAMSEWLYFGGEISGKDIFIDGTKIESCANRYTFVWKKSVTKNQAKLMEKAVSLVEQCEEVHAVKVVHDGTVTLHKLKMLRKKLYKLKEEEGITFVHGIGKRKSQLQKDIELLESYIGKLKEYTKHIHVCGDRNSYSKTDPDATFMRMKEDHMRNGQLKPGYNVQIGVNSEYITGIEVFSNRTDYGTMVPFMKTMQQKHGKKYKSATADAGYERFNNYLYLEANGQLSFIKPANYEQQKSSSFKKQIGRMENMSYDAEEDSYTCAQGRKLSLRRECTELQHGRYVTMAWYRCESCSGCPVREKCCQAKNADQAKELRVNKTFQELRRASLENITTEYGIYLRQCRSIQVEGAFGLIKNDFGFRRFLTRGRKNVRTELFFLALAFDLKKLWMKRDKGRLRTHLSEISAA